MVELGPVVSGCGRHIEVVDMWNEEGNDLSPTLFKVALSALKPKSYHPKENNKATFEDSRIKIVTWTLAI